MKIIGPTDFTQSSDNAVEYAAQMAAATDRELHFLHVVTPEAIKTPLMKVNPNELRSSAIFKLDALQRRMTEKYHIRCSFSVAFGNVTEQIIGFSQDDEVSMVIIGTFGTSPLKRFLSGSITTEVIEQCPVPVLVIPDLVKYTPPELIIFATDYHTSDIDDLKEAAFLAQHFDATIKTVHIVNRFEEEETDFQYGIIRYFSELVHKNVPYTKINFEEYQHTDISEGIRSYVDEEQADMLALSIRQKSFIERIFGKNICRDFFFEIDIPILIYHIRNKGAKI
jgi:nucleotide-binding universal stress UspA family protein